MIPLSVNQNSLMKPENSGLKTGTDFSKIDQKSYKAESWRIESTMFKLCAISHSYKIFNLKKKCPTAGKNIKFDTVSVNYLVLHQVQVSFPNLHRQIFFTLRVRRLCTVAVCVQLPDFYRLNLICTSVQIIFNSNV